MTNDSGKTQVQIQYLVLAIFTCIIMLIPMSLFIYYILFVSVGPCTVPATLYRVRDDSLRYYIVDGVDYMVFWKTGVTIMYYNPYQPSEHSVIRQVSPEKRRCFVLVSGMVFAMCLSSVITMTLYGKSHDLFPTE